MASISAPDLVLLRTGKFTCTFYLSVLQPATLLTAEINDAGIERGDRSIAYASGAGAGFALIEPGQTFEVDTADGTKKARVKSITGNQTAGTIVLDENAIDFANGQTIRIKFEYRVWPIAPRISGGVFYKLYDTAYSDQNHLPPPVAIAGPHQAAILPADTTGTIAAQVSASGDDGNAISTGGFEPAETTVRFGRIVTPSYSTWLRVTANIPQGATINGAVIDFVAHSSSGTVVVDIAGEDADNPTAPTDQADFAGRDRTTATVSWAPGAWTAGTLVQSPDISTVIQEIVNKPGFVSGNAIQIFIDESGSSDAGAFRRFVAYDGNPAQAPILRVSYTVESSITLDIDASDSYAVAQGATIATYAWSCNGGSITNATAATTTITFDTPGQYWLKLVVTDSNGKPQSAFRALFVHDASYMPYTKFDVNSVSGSWSSGGWRAAFSVNGPATVDDFPDGALVLLWYEGRINTVVDYINLWTGGDNLLFSGYIRTDNDTDDYSGGAGAVEFSAVSPEGILDEMTEFGTVSITAVTTTPVTWYEYASWLTVGRAVHHLLRWHSTALSCFDVFGLLDNVLGMQNASFTEPSLLQQVNSLGFQRGHFAKLVSDRTGRLHFATDSQYLNDAGRAALDTVFSITNNDISGAINITRQPEGRIGYCDLDGFAFDGTTGTPFISIAPGYIDTISISMAEFTGVGGTPIKNQVLDDQTDSNEKAGRVLAVANNPINEVRLDMPANYSGAFDIVPSIGWYNWGISNSSLKRALPLLNKKLVCRSVENRISVGAGTIQTSVILEPEADGADGIPGNYPTGYPAVANPPGPSWPIPMEPVVGAPLLVYTDNITGLGSAVTLGTNPASFGTPVVFSDTDVTYRHAITALSATKAVVCYANFTDSSYGRAQVLEVSGGVITPGIPDFPESGAATYIDVCALTDSKAIMVYTNVGFRAAVINVSGSTVTIGSPDSIEATAGASGTSIARLSATTAIVTYGDAGDSNIGKVIFLTISGDAITAESPVTFDGDDVVNDTSVVVLSSTQAVVTYERSVGSTVNITSRVLDISGTTITPGAAADAFTDGDTFVGLQGIKFSERIDATSFLIVAGEQASGPTNRVRAIIGSLTGSTIGYGSGVIPVTGLGAALSEPCVVIPETGTAIFAYQDNGTVYAATLGISGATVTDNDDDVTDFTGGNLSMTMLKEL